MSQFIVQTACGAEKEFDDRASAEEGKDTHDVLCEDCGVDDITIQVPGEGDNTAPDAAEVLAEETGKDKEEFEPEQEIPDLEDQEMQSPEEYSDELPDKPPVDEDPVDWMPEHFIDEIQGVPTVNRKGYAVIAAKYGVSVKAEPVTLPSETDFEYAEFRATAETEDGQTYTGFGSAHIDRQDGDDPHLLGELAETRAMKRATAWATGVGMTAASEMMGEL